MRKLSVATVHTEADGKVSVNLYREHRRERKQIYKSYLKIWDMSRINIPRVFKLTPEQNTKFVDALYTRKGKKVLNDLKNGKADRIINDFMSQQGKLWKLTAGEVEPPDNFVELIKNEPLVGKNHAPRTEVGVSKQEMWEAFVKAGLII